jgi:hypothetical protein
VFFLDVDGFLFDSGDGIPPVIGQIQESSIIIT